MTETGIYIRVKRPDGWKSVLIEDATQQERGKGIEQLSRWVAVLAKRGREESGVLVPLGPGDPGEGTFYSGYREREQAGPGKVIVGHALDPRLDLWNHSPDGFQWGYGGSGPAQLSLAILAHYFRWIVGMEPAAADAVAVEWHQRFKSQAVAPLSADEWIMSQEFVRRALDEAGYPTARR
jgi:hypothetical protein